MEVLKKKNSNPQYTFSENPSNHNERALMNSLCFSEEGHNPEGLAFCQNVSILHKAAHDARYKDYKVRLNEVFFKYNKNFKPAISFFNAHCKKNGLKAELGMKEHKIIL
jgi:hypothetical protein